MTEVSQPPIYIPSKSRALIATTPDVLRSLGRSSRIIVEEHQHDEYAERFGEKQLLVLPTEYQRDYDPCDGLGDTISKGSGPARNFAWAHSLAEGHSFHWVIDDNVTAFLRFHKNKRIPVGDDQSFTAMEDFVCQRYTNIGLAGPQYFMFAPSRSYATPYYLNHRVFSCILIRNDMSLRWRGRWNEDLILSIDVLKAGWCTTTFMFFLALKLTSQLVPGGNTELYASVGTLPKSQMAVREHPDVVRLARRYGRAHHEADFRQWANRKLIPNPAYIPPAVNPYRSKLVERPGYRQRKVPLPPES